MHRLQEKKCLSLLCGHEFHARLVFHAFRFCGGFEFRNKKINSLIYFLGEALEEDEDYGEEEEDEDGEEGEEEEDDPDFDPSKVKGGQNPECKQQ